jgi:hypothetical protein
MTDIIETLRDDREYYHGVGRNYLSNSDIGTLLNNPRQFRKPKEDNKSLAEGRYFHQSMIEPEKALLTLLRALQFGILYADKRENRN